MAKARVSAIAKEIGKTSKELIEWLNNNGEYVKTPSSTVEAPVVAKIHAAFPVVAKADEPAPAKATKKTAAAKPAPVETPVALASIGLAAAMGVLGHRESSGG